MWTARDLNSPGSETKRKVEHPMKHRLISIIVLGTIAVGACSSTASSPSASPSTSAQADCERTGGVWQAALTSCKYPAPARPGY